MHILTCTGWNDYELLDSGNGKRLERFGTYILNRPDPQIIWQPHLPQAEWNKADAVFSKTSSDKGKWIMKHPIPHTWRMSWKALSFLVEVTPFKHTGVFPEQAVHWEWIQEKIKQRTNPPAILNLFGYTGIATLAAASVGAKVTHVDASRPTIAWARENQKTSNLLDKPIRWILDDCLKFVEREVRRGVTYDGIIMDPPIFGHGNNGEVWKFNEHFPQLLSSCMKLLSPTPLFLLVNAYAISSSALMLENVLNDFVGNFPGTLESGELTLQEKDSNRLLSTGIFARWSKD